MDPKEVIEIFDDSEDEVSVHEQPTYTEPDRRTLLTPIITRVVDALGGLEGADDKQEYILGDEVYGCLKDLKKLWRKDDTDDDRTVARIFYETRVLPNDLVPILLATAGKGLVEDKRAIACVDLMTAMTWPIDIAEELKELDEEEDLERGGIDYTQLTESHLVYKAALLKTDAMKSLLGVMLPPLSKPMKERTERDGQVINVVLHLVRNLAFIKDLRPSEGRSAGGNAELTTLQGRMVRLLQETHILELLLTVAANTDNDPLFNSWNSLVLEIFYLLFRGVKPGDLAADQAKQPTANLQRLLEVEERNRREVARKASSRHSRFGTTIAVKQASSTSNRRPIVLHRQQAIHGEAGSILDLRKKGNAKKGNTVDELTREDNLSVEAKNVLKQLANDFLEGCFNPFLAGLLKDIRAERAKITQKDNLRLLYVTKWFLAYFLTMRAKTDDEERDTKWSFGLIGEVVERVWIVWVLKRMRESMEEKPKAWTELQEGIECLTQLFLLIDAMSSLLSHNSNDTNETESAESLKEAAELLLQQLIYNGEVLDISLESLKAYKEGKQSLVYLDSSIHLAYALLRMLEKWSKRTGDGTYVRQKLTKKRKERMKRKSGRTSVPETEETGQPGADSQGAGGAGSDEEDGDEDDEAVVQEVLFSFEAFEMKFANSDIAHTLLTYLGRYREFSSSEKMKRVVSLMHRQAVKAKAEGLFFNVTTLDLFKTILGGQKSLPRDQPYRDLVNLINYILRQFFKAAEEEPFLTIEAFFPKNRGHWKQYSSWEPEAKASSTKINGRNAASKNNSAEVQVKKGYSLTDQIGIVISALVDTGRKDLAVWTQDILRMAINKRKRVIDEVDEEPEEASDDEDEQRRKDSSRKYEDPSEEARKRIVDEVIPYVTEDRAEAASKNAYLKLLFRLSKFATRPHDEDDEEAELEWYIPAAIMPADLDRTRNVIMQFLETPFDLQGKKISEMLRKKRRSRRRRSLSPESDGDEASDGGLARKQQRKKKETQIYKSAQFIEDSDEEYGDMDAFLEKERLLREKAALAAEGQINRPIGMRAAGMKKRKKRGARKANGSEVDTTANDGLEGREKRAEQEQEVDSRSDGDSGPPTTRDDRGPESAPRPRPRPVTKSVSTALPRAASPTLLHMQTNAPPTEPEDEDDIATSEPVVKRRAKRLFLSDSDDD